MFSTSLVIAIVCDLLRLKKASNPPFSLLAFALAILSFLSCFCFFTTSLTSTTLSISIFSTSSTTSSSLNLYFFTCGFITFSTHFVEVFILYPSIIFVFGRICFFELTSKSISREKSSLITFATDMESSIPRIHISMSGDVKMLSTGTLLYAISCLYELFLGVK